MKRILYAALIGGLMAAPLSARAHDADKPGAAGWHGGMARMMQEQLGLSSEQMTQIEAIHKEARESAKPLRKELMESMRQLRGLVLLKKSDDEIKPALDRVRKAQADLRDAMKATQDKIDVLLTPSQQARMLLWHARHMRGERMGRGMGREGMRGRMRPGGRWGGSGAGPAPKAPAPPTAGDEDSGN